MLTQAPATDSAASQEIDSTTALGTPIATKDSFAFRSDTLPRPQPDKLLYYGNLWLALLSSPRRLMNYLKYRKYKSERGKIIKFLPLQLDIEPVSRCNFRCTMCPVSEWPKQKRAEDISFEDFKKTLDAMYGVVELKIQGLGEPLLARDNLFKMIAYARKRFIWVRTTINASLLHLNDNHRKLIDSGVSEVQISFDGATKETFESIRRGSIFEKVVDNCKLINNYSKEKNVLKTRMWVLIQQHNSSEFLEFVRLAAEMGFKRLTYSLNLHGWGVDHIWEANETATAEANISDAQCIEAMDLGKKLGVEVTFWRSADKYKTDEKKSLCPWPFERFIVASDMRVAPCCMITNPDIYELGTADNLLDLWNSPAYQDFREMHLQGNIPKVCEMCYEKRSRPKTLPILK